MPAVEGQARALAGNDEPEGRVAIDIITKPRIAYSTVDGRTIGEIHFKLHWCIVGGIVALPASNYLNFAVTILRSDDAGTKPYTSDGNLTVGALGTTHPDLNESEVTSTFISDIAGKECLVLSVQNPSTSDELVLEPGTFGWVQVINVGTTANLDKRKFWRVVPCRWSITAALPTSGDDL
jgi:hypothetical protein